MSNNTRIVLMLVVGIMLVFFAATNYSDDDGLSLTTLLELMGGLVFIGISAKQMMDSKK